MTASQTDDRADVVVVGAGSAGAVLAARLSEDPNVRVVLIEAGPDYPEYDRLPDELKYGRANAVLNVISDAHNWNFRGRGTALTPSMLVARGRVTGGSSAINGQVFLRALPEDFDGWAAAGNPRWRAEAFFESYRRLECDQDFAGGAHGADGPVRVRRYPPDEWHPAQRAFAEAAQALGAPWCPDQNGPAASGVGPVPLNNIGGVRQSTALTYLAPARSRSNLTILADTLARRINVLDGRATAVEVESAAGRKVIEADQIILSAGAIGSPHLLLLSGIGPAAELARAGVTQVHELPGVGKNFQDHPMVASNWEMAPRVAHQPDAPRCQMVWRFTSELASERDDVWIMALLWLTTLTLWSGVHAPVARGELRLVSSDPAVQPSLDYRYMEDEADRRRMRDTVRRCATVSEQEPLKSLLVRRLSPSDGDLVSDESLDEWIRGAVLTTNHIVGTCRMGPPSDPMAVVGEDGRVHGIEGLRVADASLMPKIVRAAPNATAMTIGEHMYRLIAESGNGA